MAGGKFTFCCKLLLVGNTEPVPRLGELRANMREEIFHRNLRWWIYRMSSLRWAAQWHFSLYLATRGNKLKTKLNQWTIDRVKFYQPSSKDAALQIKRFT